MAGLIGYAWDLVEFGVGRLGDPGLGEDERVRWAGVLVSLVGVLNRLLYRAGVSEREREDLAVLIGKLSKRCVKLLEGEGVGGRRRRRVGGRRVSRG